MLVIANLYIYNNKIIPIRKCNSYERGLDLAATYNSLFLVTIVALLSPWLSSRIFRGLVPAVVIEILMGILIGNSGFHIAQSTKYVNFMAEFGFSYLMFLSGLELDFDLIFERKKATGKPPWILGVTFFLATSIISYFVALLLFYIGWIQHPFVVGLVLSTTSTGILLPALKEKGWISDPFGQQLMVFGLLADMITLLAITAYVAFHTSGNAFSILLVMVLLMFFVVIYRLLRYVAKTRGFSSIENATSEMGLRGSFALILMFLAFSETLGTQVIVGAFLAGAIISLLSKGQSTLTTKLNSIGYGFLLPIFFVNVGMKFSIQALDSRPVFWIMMIVLLLTMFLNKVLPSLYFLRRFPIKQRLAGGMLLSSRLSLIIAASQIAVQIGALNSATANGLILLAIVTCLVSPLMFNRLIGGFTPSDLPLPSISEIKLGTNTLPEGWVVGSVEVRSRKVDSTPMRSLRLPQDVLFVSIIRGDERIIPRGHTILEQFDVVQVLGHPESIRRIKSQLEG